RRCASSNPLGGTAIRVWRALSRWLGTLNSRLLTFVRLLRGIERRSKGGSFSIDRPKGARRQDEQRSARFRREQSDWSKSIFGRWRSSCTRTPSCSEREPAQHTAGSR